MFRFVAALLLLLWAAPAIGGNDSCSNLETECIRTGEWEFEIYLGAGTRTNPVESADNLPLFFIPQWRYYGERWFIDNLEFGYSLVQADAMAFALVASPNDDRMYFHRWDPGNILIDVVQVVDGVSIGTGRAPLLQSSDGVRDRDYALQAGFEFSMRGEWGAFLGQMLWDVTDVHEGHELRASYSKPFHLGSWRFNPSIGLAWKSDALVDYYYGVHPGETTESVGLYDGKASLNPFIKFSADRELHDDWRWITSVRWVKLDEGIHASPIVEDENVFTVFAGVSYRF